MKNKTAYFVKVAFTSVAFFGFVALATASTWTAPTGTAPASDVAAPINVGTTTQTKAGELDVTNFYNWGTEFISGLTAIGAVWPGTTSTTPEMYVKPASTSVNAAIFGGNVGIRGILGITQNDGTTSFATGFNTIQVQGVPVCLQNGDDCPTSSGGSGTVSGTTGYLSKFTSATAVGNSSVKDTGSGIQIGNSVFNTDQGGSLELGGNNSTANTTGDVPYIDFHYGTGSVQDYNMRLVNSANGVLDVQGGDLKVNGTSVCRQDGTNCPAASGGTSGLSSVSHDSSLNGSGTSGSLLSVAKVDATVYECNTGAGEALYINSTPATDSCFSVGHLVP